MQVESICREFANEFYLFYATRQVPPPSSTGLSRASSQSPSLAALQVSARRFPLATWGSQAHCRSAEPFLGGEALANEPENAEWPPSLILGLSGVQCSSIDLRGHAGRTLTIVKQLTELNAGRLSIPPGEPDAIGFPPLEYVEAEGLR